MTVHLHITLGNRERLGDTLYQQLVEAIRSGQLREGDPLPPTRQLAAQLRVSRSTVTAVYDRLAGSGYVTRPCQVGHLRRHQAARHPRRGVLLPHAQSCLAQVAELVGFAAAAVQFSAR